MRQAQLRAYREQVVGGATGRVLEMDFGSGLILFRTTRRYVAKPETTLWGEGPT
jgi:hypothetical protein